MAKWRCNIVAVDDAVAIPVENVEGNFAEGLVGEMLWGQAHRQEREVADVAVVVQVGELEELVDVVRDGSAAPDEALLQHGDGQLAVAVHVQHAEDEPLWLGWGGYVGNHQASDAFQDGLGGESADGRRQARLELLGLPEAPLQPRLPAGLLRLDAGHRERVVQGLSDGGPPVAVVREHQPEQVLRIPRQGELLGSAGELLLDEGSDLDLPLPSRGRHVLGEEVLARQHHIQQDAAGPDVALGAVDPVPELGRHVRRGALDLLLPVEVEAAAVPEVDHEEVVEGLGGIHEVLRLDVVVAPELGVAALQRLEDVAQRHRRVGLAHPPLRPSHHPLEEVGTLAELENEVQVLHRVVELHQPHDVGVVQRHQGRDLGL
mmetsp:Transcript_32657/g.91728  ORF Transcript_32657/g.91728 Transcript_32657/m.91728 type:complete len:375 (+) Transcript_32657:307-1431(+)